MLVIFIFKIESFSISIFRTYVPLVNIVFEHFQNGYRFVTDYKMNGMMCMIS